VGKAIFQIRAATVAALLAICADMQAPAFAAVAPAKQAKPVALAEWCKRLTPRLPGVSQAECEKSALSPSGAASVQGFPILKRQLPAVRPVRDARAPVRVLLLGGIHGDELTASAIVFNWMQRLQQAPAQDFHWVVVPVVNPDGLLAPKPQRMNANGVDLNRNFPTPGWEQEAPRYWSVKTRSDPRRFPGKAPLSEPESKWVNEEIARFKPDVIISVHAPFGVLDFDGPARPPRKFGRLVFTPVGVYPGSLGNYSGNHKKVPIITIELPNAVALPPEAEVKRIWHDMLLWMQRNVSPQSERAVQIQRTVENFAKPPY
jgi:hypothetical protein